MKTKQNVETTKTIILDKTLNTTKLKSLRPMRSMLAVRSLKPKTIVASMTVKSEN